MLPKPIFVGLFAKIKAKKELLHLDEDFVLDKIKQFLQQHPKHKLKLMQAKQFAQLRKSKFVDDIVKFVRKEAREVYGLFMTPEISKMVKYLEQLAKAKGTTSALLHDLHKKLLKIHLSTKERLGLYPDLYKDLFAITGKPKKILDLGCGFTGISLFFSGIKNISYVGCEFNQQDVDVLNHYFKIIGKISSVKGKAIKLNLMKHPKNVAKYKADVVFIFKLFDILDNKINEIIMKNLKSKWIVVSFPRKTVGKRVMKQQRRAGFQKMLRRLGYEYETLTYPNELFYIVKNK